MSHLTIGARHHVTEGERAQENSSHWGNTENLTNDKGLKRPVIVDKLMYGEKQEISLEPPLKSLEQIRTLRKGLSSQLIS